MMNTSKLTKWDSAEYLKTEDDIINYIDACLEENDPQLISHALGVIARAKGMSQLARDTGLTREGLYKALSDQGNPEFSTVMKVFKGLGLKLSVQPA
jgi:probable addiction module antidote protein